MNHFAAIANLHAHTTWQIVPHSTHTTHATSQSYTPSQMQAAYGFNQISGDGTGQTIAIVDAYDDPTVRTDLQTFDTQYGLPSPPSLKVMSQTGSTTSLPTTDPTKGWEVEESLDVQWAHALAPGASIVLVEANSASDADLFTAVQMAANLPGVSVVSMSFGGGEFSGESFYDSTFTTPSGHQGVTFLASTGDNGAPGGFPAYSPNVVAVGGTTLSANSSGTYISESGWSGSGGGVSPYETQPSYQHGTVTQSTTHRAIPDVSFDADPNSGVPICDSFTNGTSMPWMVVGGTSFAAPAWGALVSIINQTRVANGLTTLDGVSQTLPMLYQLDQSTPSAFHDVTTGNNGHAAGTGYDLVTGLGSPVVNVLVPAMSGGNGGGGGGTPSTQLVFQHAPTSATAGLALTSFSVAIENQSGQILKSNTATVTLTLGSGTFSTGSATATATPVNGVATFTGLILDTAGNSTLTASISSQSGPSISVAVSPAGAKQPVWQTQPASTGVAGTALSSVVVDAEDAFGNVVTAAASVTMKITGGTFANRMTSMIVSAVSGVATFSDLVINAVGTYSLTAYVGSQSTSSVNVTISPAAASKLVWQTAPGTAAVAGTTLSSVVVAVEDAYGNVVLSDSSTVTLTLSTGKFSSGSATVTATASSGIATLSNLAINATGTYKITASDSASLTTVVSGNLVISPGSLSSLSVTQSPTTGTAGLALSPTVKVQTLDANGNTVTASTTVTLTLTGGNFASGSSTVTATTFGGIATFTGLVIDVAGNYSLAANVDSVASSSINVAVSPSTVKQLIWQTPFSTTAVAGATLNSAAVAVEDAFGNLVTAATTVTLKLTGGKFSTGTAAVTATSANGVATFSNLSINAAGSYSLTASVGSVATSAANLTVNSASVSQLVWKTAPAAKAIAGTTLNSVVVAVEDAYGNVVTSDTSTVKLTLSSGAFASGSATATVAASNGIATFGNLAINTTGTYQIAASDGTSITGVTSGNITVTPAVLASLSIQQNPSTGTAGVALAPAVQVAALDQYGNLVTAPTSVTLTLTGGTFSNKNSAVTASTIGGIATFSSLTILAAGSYTLAASSGSLNTSPFSVTVSPAAASKLVWQAAPATTAVAGATLSDIVVAVEDAFGNVVTTDTSTDTLTLSKGLFSSDSATATATASNGIATFSGLAIDATGIYKITASNSASLTNAVSGNLTISPGALSSLSVLQNPTTGTAGMSLSPAVKVQALDAYGNSVTASTTVTLTLTGGTFASGSSTFTATTFGGVATFTGLIINVAGNYSLAANVNSVASSSFNVAISPSAVKQAIWQTPFSTTAVAGTTLSSAVVAVEDAFGNLITNSTTVTLRLTGGKFSTASASATATTVNGVATFSGLSINVAGNYSLTAYVGSVATSVANLAISAASASQLAWKVAPVVKVVAGTTFNSVQVAVVDVYGNVVTSDTSTVTLTLSSGTFSSGSSTVTATASNGIATFSSLAINTTGTYQIAASDGTSLTGVTSGNVTISPAALASLSIQQNPTTGTAGVALTPAVQVAALDQFGNLVTVATPITLTLTGGTFSNKNSTVTATAIGGVATFSNLTIVVAGSYTIAASSGSFNTSPFSLTISPAAATKLAWQSAPPATTVAGTAMSDIAVAVEDAYGNVATTDNSTVTLTLSKGTFSTGSATITATASNGVATFSNVTINTAGSYRISATDSALSLPLFSGYLTISPST